MMVSEDNENVMPEVTENKQPRRGYSRAMSFLSGSYELCNIHISLHLDFGETSRKSFTDRGTHKSLSIDVRLFLYMGSMSVISFVIRDMKDLH